jgi:hypothetical protein
MTEMSSELKRLRQLQDCLGDLHDEENLLKTMRAERLLDNAHEISARLKEREKQHLRAFKSYSHALRKLGLSPTCASGRVRLCRPTAMQDLELFPGIVEGAARRRVNISGRRHVNGREAVGIDLRAGHGQFYLDHAGGALDSTIARTFERDVITHDPLAKALKPVT